MPRSRALLVPGSGSTADFVHRAFATLLDPIDSCRAIDSSPGAAGLIADELQVEYERTRAGGAEVTMMIGVSIGAHAVARWACDHANTFASTRPLLVLALPAWTGPPDATASMTRAALDQLRLVGKAAEIHRLEREFGHDWVVAEVVRAWRTIDESELLATMAATAVSTAPTRAELARITAPTVVVELRDDPMHPSSVARTWAAAIPGAALVGVDRAEPGKNLAVFGDRVIGGLGHLGAAQRWGQGAAGGVPCAFGGGAD